MSCKAQPSVAAVWLTKGAVFQDVCNYYKSIKCFDKVISIEENNVEAWFCKGATYKLWKKYVQAIECYDRLIGLDSKNSSAWTSKGIAMRALVKVFFSFTFEYNVKVSAVLAFKLHCLVNYRQHRIKVQKVVVGACV